MYSRVKIVIRIKPKMYDNLNKEKGTKAALNIILFKIII